MSCTTLVPSECDRGAARSERRVRATASGRPLGPNVIAFGPIKAPNHLQKDHDPGSARAGAEVIPLGSRRRLRSATAARPNWAGEIVNEESLRYDHSRRMRVNMLAIGWVGTLMAVAYGVLTLPMH
jgi:hypothetical protein